MHSSATFDFFSKLFNQKCVTEVCQNGKRRMINMFKICLPVRLEILAATCIVCRNYYFRPAINKQNMDDVF